MFDVRFLRNPHYDDRLRPFDGRSQDVADYIAADSAFSAFYERLVAFLTPLMPRFLAEGRAISRLRWAVLAEDTGPYS